jgi:error-prone DNA polymerase
MAAPDYAELFCRSNFSFGLGASTPEELVKRAHALGYAALALVDECSVSGLVRAHSQAKKCGLKLLPGAYFEVPLHTGGCPFGLIALPHDLQAWGDLCQFITRARRSAAKGHYQVIWPDPAWATLAGCEVLLVLPLALSLEAACAITRSARSLLGQGLCLAVTSLLRQEDVLLQHKLSQIADLTGVPLVAAGDVLMHVRSRKPLQDVITAVRCGQAVSACGFALRPNAENHLRTRERLANLYPPALLAHTLAVAARCRFSLDELRYQYPLEAVLPGQSAAQTLRQYTLEGASRRYPDGLPDKVQRQLDHELALIAELKYEMYFLTVHDIVAFARSQGILCQGRGSAANSAVCYCLGVTEVDPARSSLLFERFISRERDEPPDIDVDFEHQRREEVIQYIYQRYGRDRAALTAVVVSYRPRSALRDVGRALGVPETLISAMAREHPGMHSRAVLVSRLQSALQRWSGSGQAGADSEPCALTPLLDLWLDLSQQLQGFARHLSQHVGGFVLTQGPLTRLVPVENAAMPQRSVIQWDKDDLDAMGLLKVDVLALGMLSAIRRCLDLVSLRRGQRFQVQDIPADDAATFEMICRADTVGVFQIESRAQMSMLPRLRPRCFYDLVIEVAIVRPGPIQGGMVHPYLKARSHPDQVVYPSAALKTALQRTLGVPIFQEQVMQIAMVAANFSPGEADELRRSMAAWKRKGGVHKFHDRVVKQMVSNGYDETFAENIFRQIEGFGEYGFPESHAASFALITYVSCWLKWHEPACFLAAMLNSQPLGFYGPSQLVQDAQRHGVTVLPVDVSLSGWDCSLALGDAGPRLDASTSPAVRLGLRMVSGLGEPVAQRITQARAQQPFIDVQDLALRAALDSADLKTLASADALHSLAGHRRQQVWDASALRSTPALLREATVNEERLTLPAAPQGEEVRFDYAALGLSLRAHPLSLLRSTLAKMKMSQATGLRGLPDGRRVRACGLVTMRQSPATAKGVTFVTLEDETGFVNVIIWKALKEKQRAELLHAQLLAVHGSWQRDEDSGGQVCHLIARHLQDLTPLLGELSTRSRDFH